MGVSFLKRPCRQRCGVKLIVEELVGGVPKNMVAGLLLLGVCFPRTDLGVTYTQNVSISLSDSSGLGSLRWDRRRVLSRMSRCIVGVGIARLLRCLLRRPHLPLPFENLLLLLCRLEAVGVCLKLDDFTQEVG